MSENKYNLYQEEITISNNDDYSVLKTGNNSNLVEIIGRCNPMSRIYNYLKETKSNYASIGIFANCTTTSMPIIAEIEINLPISVKVKYLTLTMGFNHNKWIVGDRSTTKLPNGNYHGNIILLDEDLGAASELYTTKIRGIVGVSRQFALALIDEIENKLVDPSKYGTYINYHVIGEL